MRKKAIGIDLGTTNSVMAVVREDVPEIIPMGTNDDQVLRSAVYFSNISGQNHVSFGKEAIERGTEIGSTENFKFDFKRDIGRPIASDTPDHTRVNSIILSALVLNEFRKRAYVVGQEMGQADGIKDAVITVPAYFTSDQRAATKNAGRIAGFNVLRIINEPTAAAIAYAHTKSAQGNVLVFDLGGGTFDVTIMRVADHAYDILATDGNSRLGGIDFDKRLVGYIMQELEKQGVNMTNLSEKEKIQLQYKAEQIKTSLSVNDQALYEHYVNGQGYGVLITQAIFNEITLDLLKDTEIKVQST
ncbi:MAG: Hsp70 family protein, partial [Streptococcus sp.]|nr:Hsp70 family protein [Streptococcus sp.]